jgi:hypothetical protein
MADVGSTMALRPSFDKDAAKQINDRLDKLIGRAYILWLFGVAAGLIRLKAEKLSFSGVEYTIANPEVIQGLIFVACLLCYVAIFGLMLIYSLQWSIPNRISQEE